MSSCEYKMKQPLVHYDYGGDADTYEDYYVNQSGHGLPVFYGQRTQKVMVFEIF